MKVMCGIVGVWEMMSRYLFVGLQVNSGLENIR
jgi:hypothetical protein